MSEEAEKEKEAEDAISIGDLRKLITETVEGILGKGDKTDKSGEKRESEGESIADQVAREINKLRAKEAREKRDQDIDKDLQELKELKAKVEKSPVERNRRHKIMGWGE